MSCFLSTERFLKVLWMWRHPERDELK